MGLDGGTKITRSDVLRGQSWRMAQQDSSRSTRGGSVNHVYQEQQIDEQVRRTTLWTTCALSGLPLQPPVVADALGQLFNKQSVLEHLLAAKASTAAAVQPPPPMPAAAATPAGPAHTAAGSIVPYAAAPATCKDLAAACLRYKNQQRAAAAAAAASGSSVAAQGTFDHLKSLKDVFAVTLTPNPDAQPAALASLGPAAAVAGGGTLESCTQELPSPWMCPVTMQPCGSKQPFSALRRCGHVLSDKALAAIVSAASQKPKRVAGTCQSTNGCSRQPEEQDPDDLSSSCDGCCCPVCEAPFDAQTDRVPINASQQHMDTVRRQLQEAAAAKARAKQKKRRRTDTCSTPEQRELCAGQAAKQLQLTGGVGTGKG